MEDEEIAGHLRRAGHFRRTWNTQDEQIEDEAKVLSHEGSELQTADDSVRVGVVHVLVVDDHVVLGRHVIGDVVIDDETQKTIEQCTNRSFRTVPATNGTSNARRMKPDLKLNGLGAHNSAISVQNIHSYLEKKLFKIQSTN